MHLTTLKKYLADAISWLIILSTPSFFAALLTFEDVLTNWLDNVPTLWRFRAEAILLCFAILLSAALYLKREKFIEHQGGLFKRNGNGGYHKAVYCPLCKISTSYEGDIKFLDKKFRCRCGWVSNFNLGEFNEIIKLNN
jgi:hypothetical protein